MLQIAICEDNPEYLSILCAKITKSLNKTNISGQIVCATSDPEILESYIKSKRINVYFLDIDLNSKTTGYNLAEKIRNVDLKAYIIFITGHFEYVLHAFKVQCFDFLPKPVSGDIIDECLKKVNKNYTEMINEVTASQKHIRVHTGSSLHNINISDIVLVERLNSKTIIHTKNSRIFCKISLETMQDMLKENNFVRCHRSFIINGDYVCEVNLKEKIILLTDQIKCFLGSKYKNNVLNCLK